MTIEDCDREAAKAAYREWLKGPMDGTDYCEIADIAARISRKATIAGVVAYLRTIPLDQMDGAMIDAIECGEAFGELKP